MKDARQELSYSQARIVGDTAWVGTESITTHDQYGSHGSMPPTIRRSRYLE